MHVFENLVDVFKTAVATYPDNELFGTKKNGVWEWTTYLEFGKQVDQLRAGLHEAGLARGDKVCIIANNRVEWAVAAYACYGVGAAFVPMYEAQNPKEWEFITHDCGAKFVFCASDEIVKKVQSFMERVPSIKTLVSLDPKSKSEGVVRTYTSCLSQKKFAGISPSPKDPAGLIYTSGTTGNPKGVILSHGNIASNVNAVHEVFPMAAADRSLSFLPWAHVFGQTVELHCMMSMGASMAIAESVEKIIDNLSETKPTLLFSVPRIFNKIYASVQKQIAARPDVIQKMVRTALAVRNKQRIGDQIGLIEGLTLAVTDKVVFSKVRARFGGRLKYAFSGGAAISKDVAEFIDGLGITVYEGYGLTETSPIATANWPGNRRIGSVGKPIPGVKISITAEHEIVIHGPNIMQGYHNREEENKAVFTSDGGFRTGDMGRVDNDGFVFITGRIKEQYKLENGKYVVPTPLEEQIKLSPYVLNVMVYGDNRPFNVALIVANVDAVKTATGTDDLNSSAVRKLFEKELATNAEKFKGFEEIRDFALIGEDFSTENNMLTPSLKLKRRVVVETYKAELDALYTKKRDKPAGGSEARA